MPARPPSPSRKTIQPVARPSLLAIIALSLVLLDACAPPPPTTTPPGPPTSTPAPPTPEMGASSALPPATPTTAPSTPTPSPTATLPPTATPTPYPITLEPSPTPTPEPTLPEADIRINTPGPLSKVTSPMLVQAFLEPGAGGRVRLELFGEDGRLLVRKLLVFSTLLDRKITLSTEIDFEIAGVAEVGRLSLSVDDRFGRLRSLASVDLILLSSGDADINPPGDGRAPIIILEPEPEAEIEGGEVLISGLARPAGDQPLVLELFTQDGKLVGSRQAAVAETPAGEHRPFAATIPYQVSDPTRVLLVVRERGNRIPGTAQLTSREIVIRP